MRSSFRQISSQQQCDSNLLHTSNVLICAVSQVAVTEVVVYNMAVNNGVSMDHVAFDGHCRYWWLNQN